MIQRTPQPDRPPQKPARARGGAGAGDDGPRRRWRTVFVDGSVLEARSSAERSASWSGESGSEIPADLDGPDNASPPLQLVARLDDEVAAVRKNVRDAAAAVLAWLAAVVGHEGQTDLDDVLDRCLRPGPDIERVNYAAMALDIFRVTGIELTPKRVQTAVTHLRAAHEKKHAAARVAADAEPATPTLGEKLAALHESVRQQFEALVPGNSGGDPGGDSGGDSGGAAARREVGTQVLTAVRSAAGRVIDRDFGEGIPQQVSLPALESRFLDFVRDTLRDAAAADAGLSDAQARSRGGSCGDRGSERGGGRRAAAAAADAGGPRRDRRGGHEAGDARQRRGGRRCWARIRCRG